MLAELDRVFFGRTYYAAESKYSLDESLDRIRAIVKPAPWFGPFSTGFYGRVSADHIMVFRLIPLVHNSFKPVFYGHFQRVGAQLKLVGVFTEAKSVKIFVILWAFMVLLFAGLAAVLPPPQAAGLASLPIALWPFGMIAFLVALNFVGRLLSSKDIDRIAAALDKALS